MRCSGCWATPIVPPRSLWSGALFGAIGFEVLKQLSSLLLSTTEGQPAFQAFGIALILLVWINYFSRVVMYAASWAYTTTAARALRTGGADQVQGPKVPSLSSLARRLTTEAGVGRAGGRRGGRDARPRGAGQASQALAHYLPWRSAACRSQLRREITSSGISFGQAAVHSPMLVQPPNPSWSCWPTMLTTRVSRSAWP